MKTKSIPTIIVALLAGILLLGPPAAVLAAEAVKAPARPNIIFILADDLGYMDIGANNPKGFYETPNIDALAARGMRFTQGYAACPVCSPTRASIMTGKYPGRTGVTDFIGAAQPEKWSRPTQLLPAPYQGRLALEEITIAEALRDAGYTNFFAGKWHLGAGQFSPNAQGFGPDLPVNGTSMFFYPSDAPPVDRKNDPKTTDLIADAAVRFIEGNKERPFFAYLPFQAPHNPIGARADLVAKYERKRALAAPDDWGTEGASKVRLVQNHAAYAAMLEQMDAAIGRVLGALDRSGLAESTIIVFMSDNGGLSTAEGHPTSNLPLRAGKGWLYEGGIREPMIIRAPGVTRPGSTCDVPVISTDFYPTLLELAGLPLQPKQHLDGVSLVPLLKGGQQARGPIFWHYPHYGNQGGAPGGAVRDGDWKWIEWYEGGMELFNLRDDPGEKRNLAKENPAKAKALQAKLAAWRKDVGALMPAPNPKFTATSLAAEAAKTPDRPNIVFILADDLGYGDLGCYNSNSKIPTPNLDRLAAQGMRFTDAHSPASVCTPTRYALLTGRYAWRSSLKRGVIGPWGEPILAADRLTVPTMLKRHGYTTGMIGKWHLGWNWPTKNGAPAASGSNRLSNVDFTKPIANGPTTRGFDYYFGVDVPNYPPYCFIENDRTLGIPSVPDAGRAEFFNHPGPMLPGWRMVDILPTLTQRAVKWVGDAAKSGRPFFLYVPLTSPHYPVVPSPEFKGKSKAGDYGDFVYQTDWTVGQIMQALEKAGVASNTIVIFTSDNGPEVTGEVNPGVYDRIRQFQHRSMGELRGAKRDTWEGGHRVPFLASWPGHIKSGAVSGETICHVDFMATVAELLKEKLPANAGEDSFSLLPALLGEKTGGPVREAVVHHAGSGKFALRKGDWVLIDSPTGEDNRNNGEPQWLRQERGYAPDDLPGQLFNVREDLAERKNHFAEKPALVSELKELLEKYKSDGRSTPGAAQANDEPRAPRSQPASKPAIKPPAKGEAR